MINVEQSRIRTLLLDSHCLVRHAIADLINSMTKCEIVSQASSASEAFEKLRSDSSIGLVILEMVLPQVSGLEFLLELQRRRICLKALVLTSVDSPDMISQALLAGAQGYVLKSSEVSELEKALEVVCLSDKRYLPTAMSHLSKITENSYELSQPKPNDPLGPLSAREREIFHLLASGLQNTGIAKKLFISPRTVETHRARIVRKLRLHKNGEIIRYSIKHGLSTL